MHLKNRITSKVKALTATAVSSVILSTNAFAQIPIVEANSAGEGEDAGIFAFASGWVKDLIEFGVPTVLGAGFLWSIWELGSKVQEQRNSREPHWGGVIAFGGGVAAYVLAASFLGFKVLGMFGAAAP